MGSCKACQDDSTIFLEAVDCLGHVTDGYTTRHGGEDDLAVSLFILINHGRERIALHWARGSFSLRVTSTNILNPSDRSLRQAFVPVVEGRIGVGGGSDAVGNPLDPELGLCLGAFDFRSRTLDEGADGDARVVAILDEAPPGVIVENEGAALIQHVPTHDCIMQDVDGGVGCIDVDEVESTAVLPEVEQSLVAAGLDDAQLGDLLAFGDVAVEAVLQGGELVAIDRWIGGVMVVLLMLHAALESVDGSHEGVRMSHEIVQDPSGGATFERANFENAELAMAQMCGPSLPIGANQVEPASLSLEGEATSIIFGLHRSC